MDHLAPFRVGKNRGHDIAEIDQREEQQHPLDHPKRAAQHHEPDQEGGDRDRHIAGDVAEQQLGPTTDAGKLRDRRRRIGEEEEDHHPERGRHAETFANQVRQSLAGDRAHPGNHGLNRDQTDRRHDQQPQQVVAELRAGQGIAGDPGGIIVDIAGDNPGSDHREQQHQPGSPATEEMERPGERPRRRQDG